MRLYYIMKDGLYLKADTATYESDYWGVSDITAEHKTRYLWTAIKAEAKYWTEHREASRYLTMQYKQAFFKGAEVF